MNYHYLFSGENLYQFSILLKDYDIYQILPFNNGLLKIDPSRPENNIFHLSNFIFKKDDIVVFIVKKDSISFVENIFRLSSV